MRFDAARELDEAYVMHTFARKPVEFVRGSGMKLFDDEGKEYLDFLSGIGVVSVGHCNPRVTAAIQQQAAKLLHVSNYYYVEHRGEVAACISAMLSGGGDACGLDVQGADARGFPDAWKVFFANSGAEANEGAIKLARLWGKANLDGAYGILSAARSFHGRTLGALAATAQDNKQDPFAPLPAGFGRVPLNDIAALAAALDSEIDGTRVCAVMLEPIQGEAGVWPCSREYLAAARKLTRERGMLLVLDEVQTGFFRTGMPFAFQHYGVEPDIVSMAKGMGGGVPIGAFAAAGEVAGLLKPGMHGTTFGGSPLVCAAARATCAQMLEEGFGEHVARVGSYLRAQLAELPFVVDVRGEGLMCGVTLAEPVAPAFVDAALERGLVLNAPAADIVRFLPPLIAQQSDVDTLIERLAALGGEWFS